MSHKLTLFNAPVVLHFTQRKARARVQHKSRARGERRGRPVARIVAALLAGIFVSSTGHAQTDYYNTDAGRPIRIEDAYAIERRAFELQAAPLRLERSVGGRYRWGIEPEIAYGVLPRTQLEIGFPIAWIDGATGRSSGLAGIDVSLLYNLNVETSIPALAVAFEALLPVGNLAPERTYASAKAIATKTFPFARFHVNAQYTVGDAPAITTPVGAQISEVTRWLSGIAIDRTFPLRSLLLTGELYAQQGLVKSVAISWNATVGTRYQLSPRWAFDAGLGRRLTGDEQTWSLTMGGAVAFGLPWSR